MVIRGVGALVTGGASGLGEATVRRLAGAGADVTIVDHNADAGDALARELGGATRFVEADVGDPEQVATAVRLAGETAPLRIACNIAGIADVNRTVGRDGAPADLERFKRVINVNLVGTFNVLRLAAAAMACTEPLPGGERGVVVNTASVAAFDGQVGQVAYAASKGGVVGLTLPAARDLSVVGVRVCSIAPGTFDTPLLGLLAPAAKDALAADVLFPKRLGQPEEFAALVAHIVENPYLNGEIIRLDGGLRMPPK